MRKKVAGPTRGGAEVKMSAIAENHFIEKLGLKAATGGGQKKKRKKKPLHDEDLGEKTTFVVDNNGGVQAQRVCTSKWHWRC